MREVWIEKKIVMGAASASARAIEAGAMFGVIAGSPRELAVVKRCRIPLPSGGIVFVTGPSGGGKSTILRLIAEACRARREVVIEVGKLDAARCDPGLPRGGAMELLAEATCRSSDPAWQGGSSDPASCSAVVDAVGGSLDEAMRLLSIVGLADAFVMMRRPEELSDGQRYRLAMAKAIEAADQARRAGRRAVLLADEFGATLDRVTALTMARNVRRWVSLATPGPPEPPEPQEPTEPTSSSLRLAPGACEAPGSSLVRRGAVRDGASDEGARVTLVCATTHDDLLEALEPEVLVWKGLGEEIEVVVR